VEDEQFRKYSKSWNRADELHPVPQERHANGGGLFGTIGGERPITGVEGVKYGMCNSLQQAGVLPNSQPPTPGTGPWSVMKYTYH
jgi:hypothetical protein